MITPAQFMASSPDPPWRGPWITASYGGECSGCGEEIYEGDQIRADGEGGWLGSCCGEDDEGGFDRHGVSGYEL